MKELKKMKESLGQKQKELKILKAKAEKSLKKAPEGSLVLSKSNGVTQYFHKTKSKEKKGKYIPKKEEKLIRGLAQKDYDQKFLKIVDKQIKQIESILKNFPQTDPKDIFSSLSEVRRKWIIPHAISDEEYAKQWGRVKYEGKNYAKEVPIHVTDRGERVRSKSEKMIADKLNTMGIPYRYEYPLYLRTFGTVYPDFTLLDTKKREEIYFEHFGRMSDPEYSEKAVLKIQEYARNGIYLGKNLIVTFETKDVPLDMTMVEKMIMEFLSVE